MYTMHINLKYKLMYFIINVWVITGDQFLSFENIYHVVEY
jgi:hypothetical protein